MCEQRTVLIAGGWSGSSAEKAGRSHEDTPVRVLK